MIGRVIGALAMAAALAACGETVQPVRATGSSTIYPFTQAVAAAFVAGEAGRAKPLVDSTGTAAGIASFCAGVDADTPDIVNASRRMRRAEYDRCRNNGVRDVIEVRIGLDGIALGESNRGPKLTLTSKDLYLALAANPLGKPNAAKVWRDVNPALPAVPIKVFGPPAGSGTRDLFIDQILEPGCIAAIPKARQLQTGGDPAVFDRTCRQLRGDGPYVSEGENDDVTVQAIERDPQSLGLFGYSYLERNAARVHGVPIDGATPDYAAISTGKYPGGRTLYLYVKRDHLKKKPELQAFLELYATMWNPGGPLTKQGLIPMGENARTRAREVIQSGEVLDGAGLI